MGLRCLPIKPTCQVYDCISTEQNRFLKHFEKSSPYLVYSDHFLCKDENNNILFNQSKIINCSTCSYCNSSNTKSNFRQLPPWLLITVFDS